MGVWVSIHHVLSYPKSLLTTQAPSQIYPWWIIASGWMGFWIGQPTTLLIPSIISPGCSGKWSPHITKCSFLRLFNALPIQCKCVWMKHTGTSFCKWREWVYFTFTSQMRFNQVYFFYFYYWQPGCLWRHELNSRTFHVVFDGSWGHSQLDQLVVCAWRYINFNYRGQGWRRELGGHHKLHVRGRDMAFTFRLPFCSHWATGTLACRILFKRPQMEAGVY